MTLTTNFERNSLKTSLILSLTTGNNQYNMAIYRTKQTQLNFTATEMSVSAMDLF